MAFKMKTPSTHKGTQRHKEETRRYKELKVAREATDNMPDGRSKSSPFQAEEEFPGLLPEVEVKMSKHQTRRDRLAKEARKGKSGTINPGMEQTARSLDYKDADKYLAKEGDKEAIQRLKDREERVSKERARIEASENESPAKVHEPGHTKEIKGTSIFGKSPKEFAKSLGKHALNVATGGVSNLTKKAYDKYKGKKTTKPQRGRQKAVTWKEIEEIERQKEGAMEAVGKKAGRLMQVGKKVARPTKKKRMMKKEMKDVPMKPPYKKPVGPRADESPAKHTKEESGFEHPHPHTEKEEKAAKTVKKIAKKDKTPTVVPSEMKEMGKAKSEVEQSLRNR